MCRPDLHMSKVAVPISIIQSLQFDRVWGYTILPLSLNIKREDSTLKCNFCKDFRGRSELAAFATI